MTKTILTLFFLFSLLEVQAQTVISSCSATDSIQELYKEDAALLALKWLYDTKSSDTISIAIPQAEKDTIMKSLMAVYNATSLAARDTVIEIFNIHAWPSPSKSIIADVMDTNTSITYFLNNTYPTGNAILDTLINTYKLTVTSVNIGFMPYTFIAELSFPTMLNSYALVDSISLVPGVSMAEINYPYGDGNTISFFEYLTGSGTFHKLIYSYGWGDCLSGCINRRSWEFNIYPDCSVEYLGSYGSLLDSTLASISKYHNNEIFINVYPNPVSANLSMALNGISNQPLEIRFIDAIGNTVLSDHKTLQNDEILNYSLKSFKSGIYSLNITSQNQILSKIIIKE